MTTEDFLAAVPLFADLASDHLRLMAGAGRTRTLQAGDAVFREGDASDGLYIVLRGSVRIYKQHDNGTEVDLLTAGAGGYFGELALLDGGARSASVACLASCEFFVLEREAFLGLLAKSPQLLAATLSNLTQAVRKTSERVLQEAMEQLTIRTEMELARYRSLAQMVAGVAHEINTPIGIVNTAASVVKRRLSHELFAPLANDPRARATVDDVRQAIELIEANIGRAHKLIQDFKKLSVGQISDTKEKLDLAAVIDEVVGLFKINARQAKLTIDVRNHLPEAHRSWLGYRGYLTQVLLNLFTNIERYAYPDGVGGRVEIDLSAAGGPTDVLLVIVVRDFGRGIAPENLPRVFDPFFTTGRSKGGTGLGMAIVHTLVTNALQGSIELTSELGSGTSVTLRLPKEAPAVFTVGLASR